MSTTEDGSYYLNGATSTEALLVVVREPDATWVIPSDDEWYKAAYHYNDGVTGNYYDYPTSSDSVPSNDLLYPDAGNNANFNDGDFTIGLPYYRTIGGDFENSESPYGTFDQGGNVWEWNEAVFSCSYRGIRGGFFGGSGGELHAAYRYDSHMYDPTNCSLLLGFRVAEVSPSVPEDLDHDGDVDLHDYALFQAAFKGSQ
jgi:formylglycine-generating enzyme required for sulfatase activity